MTISEGLNTAVITAVNCLMLLLLLLKNFKIPQWNLQHQLLPGNLEDHLHLTIKVIQLLQDYLPNRLLRYAQLQRTVAILHQVLSRHLPASCNTKILVVRKTDCRVLGYFQLIFNSSYNCLEYLSFKIVNSNWSSYLVAIWPIDGIHPIRQFLP